jgi:hypothetical protein
MVNQIIWEYRRFNRIGADLLVQAMCHRIYCSYHMSFLLWLLVWLISGSASANDAKALLNEISVIDCLQLDQVVIWDHRSYKP